MIAVLGVCRFFTRRLRIVRRSLLTRLILTNSVDLTGHRRIISIVANVVRRSTRNTIDRLFVHCRSEARIRLRRFLRVLRLNVRQRFRATRSIEGRLNASGIVTMRDPSSIIIPSLTPQLSSVVRRNDPTRPRIVTILTRVLRGLRHVIMVILINFSITNLRLVRHRRFQRSRVRRSNVLRVVRTTTKVLKRRSLIRLITSALTASGLRSFNVTERDNVDLVFCLRVRLNDGACASRRARQVVEGNSVQVRQDNSSTVLRIVSALGQVSGFTGAILIRTSHRDVSNRITAILIVLRNSVLCGQLTQVAIMAFLSYSRRLRFYVLVLGLYNSRVSRRQRVYLLTRLLLRNEDRLGSTPRRRSVGVVKETLRRRITRVSACCVTFRERHVHHL